MLSQRNKTLSLSQKETKEIHKKLLTLDKPCNNIENILDTIVLGDSFDVIPLLPRNFVDLLIIDPPYNLSKNFGNIKFKKTGVDTYTKYLDLLFETLMPVLTPNATAYICADWYSSVSVYEAASKYFYIQNRITWQREKGRGAKHNWKNAHEDIWFCTVGKDFLFNTDTVKMRRKVMAPYKKDGVPKDWIASQSGNFRDTYPSNFWDDITIPYWSMKENTDHPTQKPEKLLARLMLASSEKGSIVFDPFFGSGTTGAVAKKISKRYIGIEIDMYYTCLAKKRIDAILPNEGIQGYEDGVFWERNTLHAQRHIKKTQHGIFE